MLNDLAQKTLAEIARILLAQGQTLGLAESCTGGLISAWVTSLPGSSGWYKGGVVSYANEVKTALLNVPEEVLAARGAVSEAVARRMAEGALTALETDYSLAVTGIAGPDGGTPEKPVGTVWLAWGATGRSLARLYHFQGDRREIRAQAAQSALSGLLELLKTDPLR